MGLSGAQVTQLMNHPHRSRLYAVIHVPSTVFECDVETGFNNEHNVVAVPYENGVGTPSDVLDGMTVFVYDSQDRLRGKIRAKGADASYIYLAENDEVTFDDGQSIVITDAMPFWVKYPTCDVSGSSPVFYKDYNVAYVDQNTYPPPVPILGPALRCIIRDESDQMSWSAAASYSPRTGGTISTYSWTFAGGSPGSSGNASETVTYSTPGLYRTTLTVTDDQGKTATAYRWIRVLSTRQDVTIIDCTVALNGSYERGGWSARIEGHTNTDLTDTPDHSLVAVMCDTVDGDGDILDFGGFTGANNVYFCGYFMRDTVDQDPNTERVSFEAATIDKMMADTFSFDAFIHDESSPASWIEMNGVTPRKAGNHLIRWHSNLMEIADVHLPTDTTPTAGIDMPQGDFFSQLRNMCQSVRLLQVGCSRYGSLHIQQDVQHMKWTARYTYDKNFTMFKDMWTGSPLKVPRKHIRKVSMLECAAVRWSGGEADPLFSRAPGTVPVREGKVEQVSGLAAADQDDLNTLCGMIYAEKINPVTDIAIQLAGDLMPGADIFPQIMVQAPNDFTIRGDSYSAEWLVVREINFRLHDGGVPVVDWTVDVMCQESTARVFYYPLEPLGPIEPPENPPPPPPPPPYVPPPETFPDEVIVLHRNALYVGDVSLASPVWTALNNNLSNPLSSKAVWFSRDPVYPNEVGYLCTRGAVYRNDGLLTGGNWNVKLNKTAAIAAMNDSIGGGGGNVIDCDFRKMKPQVSLPGALYVAAAGEFTGSQSWNSIFIFVSYDRGNTWSHSHYLGDRCDSYYGYEWWTRLDSWESDINEGQLIPSAHNPHTVWVSGQVRAATANSRQCFWRLYDGNFSHSLSWERWGGDTYVTGKIPAMHIPYKDNPGDDLIYILNFDNSSYWYLSKWDNGGWIDESGWRVCSGRSAKWEGFDNLNCPVEPRGVPSLVGTFTYDKLYIWVCEYGGRAVALSEDGGASWSYLTNIPESGWASGCSSGFPYNKSLFFVGRNPKYKVATGSSPQMLYYSEDGGGSWVDATGDLFTKTGGGGLVCIAPRWN